MDTSPEYIKMCEKAEEIQGEWKHNWGDWFYSFKVGRIKIVEYADILNWDKKSIWLPRQDQLQEMVDNLMTTPYSMFVSLIEWCDGPYFGSMPFPRDQEKMEKWSKYLDYFKTAEQLWLAFVMKEKYGKTWNGEDWVRGGDKE